MVVVCAVLAFQSAPHAQAVAQSASTGLTISGNILRNDAGGRVVIKGVNLELYRDPGCGWFGDQQWQQRTRMINAYRNLNINAVRLNYSAAYLESAPQHLVRFMDFAADLAAAGIYFMPTDHTFTGRQLTDRRNVWPTMRKITDAARQRGISQWLVWNPYNEPGGAEGDEITWPQWVAAQKDTIQFLRSLPYGGVIVLDTRSWAGDFDLNSVREVMAFDANVMFSNHWYPNLDLTRVRNTSANANTVPMVVGELGQYNPGVTAILPGYVRNVIRYYQSEAIPAGHNGLFAWIWSWCDDNGMTEDNYLDESETDTFVTLNSYGRLWRDEYFGTSQSATVTPRPATQTITPNVTPAATTLTPPPTNTRRPTVTRTPVPISTVECSRVVFEAGKFFCQPVR